MTLGERLEEARKRKGISLREAAEATKIRGDFLAALESGEAEIPLPPVYSRGFLKIYAKFLRLDVDRVMADHDAHARARRATRSGHGASARAPLGRVEIPQPGRGSTQPAVSNPPAESGPGEGAEPERQEAGIDTGTAVQVIAGVLVVIVVIVATWGMVRRFSADEDAAPPAQPAATVAEPAKPSATDLQRATLVALDDVTILIDQIADGQRIYSGTLTRGERLPLEFRGAVRIRFSEGRNLEIERNGQRLTPQRVGTGNLTLR